MLLQTLRRDSSALNGPRSLKRVRLARRFLPPSPVGRNLCAVPLNQGNHRQLVVGQLTFRLQKYHHHFRVYRRATA